VNAPSLRRFARSDSRPRCDLCAALLDERHGHLVALDQRALRCACRGCYLLFTPDGAGGARLKAVPTRYLHDPANPVSAADWDALGIPVGTAFFFTNSDLDRVVACYPSPAGATESLLDLSDLDEWHHPLLAEAIPDVEAVFVHHGDAFLVPIDRCYALVGELRRRWRGIDGGAAARQVISDFAADLRNRTHVSGAPGQHWVW
jgi:hypothetical protein